MNGGRRAGWVALALALSAVPVVSCGNYDPEPRPVVGGSAGDTTSTGRLDTAAQEARGGSGGSSGVTPVQASCLGVTPCGGDVVGTWVAAGSCLPVSGDANMAGFGLGCTA